MSTTLYEAEMYGGQIVNTPEVENYPAVAKISGFDFATNLYNQAMNLGAVLEFGKVESIAKTDSGFDVTLASGKVDTAKAVILAVGASNRHMGIAREDELLGKGISYCATCDGAFYKGKTVAVTGGGNTAVEDAIYLAGIVDTTGRASAPTTPTLRGCGTAGSRLCPSESGRRSNSATFSAERRTTR